MGNLKEKNDIILKSLGYHLRLIRQEKQLRQKTVAKFVIWIAEVILILRMVNVTLRS